MHNWRVPSAVSNVRAVSTACAGGGIHSIVPINTVRHFRDSSSRRCPVSRVLFPRNIWSLIHNLYSAFCNAASKMDGNGDPERQQALQQYKDKLLESREWEAKLKALRMDIKGLQANFETTEENIKALQSVGQIIGEVLKQLDEERCRRRPSFCGCERRLLTVSQSLSRLPQDLDMSLAAGQRSTRRSSSKALESPLT